MPIGGLARAVPVVILIVALHGIAGAQTLTLTDAMARARTDTPEARALDASTREAGERVREARSGFWPRVDLAAGVQRGNQPVFVFSSLLAQRRFTAADFALDQLNHPAPLTNTRTAITIAQSLFDGGSTRLAVAAAHLDAELTTTTRSTATQDLALRAARAFVRVLQLEAAMRADTAAVDAATSDLQRARARRDVGVVTDADVLAVDVHLADMRQRQLADGGDLASARIELCQAIGAPLDATFRLTRPALPATADDVPALVRNALAARPDVRAADVQARLADNAHRAAGTGFMPRVGAQGGWEFNGEQWNDQRSSWVVGADVQINLFRGFADAARRAETRQAIARAAAERDRVAGAAEVEVRTAAARLDAARARADAGRQAKAQAEASQRIVRDRYDSGLATVTDVLRAAEAVLDAESRATAAEMDAILQSVALDRAVGRL